MSDLLAILSQGASSLAAQRAALATASHNLQNANTPGYARQRAVLATTLPSDRSGSAYIGRGALLQTVTQSRDRFLEAQIPAQLGSAARSSAQASVLSSVSALDPDGAGGVSGALSAFYASLRAMDQYPSDTGLRAEVVASAHSLGLALQRTRGSLEDARTGVDASLGAKVSEVNDLAAQVAALNGDIRTARASGGEPNDLLDARQKAVDRLAELTGVSPVPTSEGDVALFLPGGAALVSGLHASSLSTLADASNDGHLSVKLAGPNGAAIAFTGLGGELGGLVDARDGALKAAVTALDTMAWDYANTFNGIHRIGFGLENSTGRDFFTIGTTLAGAASRIDVAAAISADPRRIAAANLNTPFVVPGDQVNLARLIATETTNLSGGRDTVSTLSKIVSDFGVASQHAEALSSQDAAIRDNLTTMRESQSGVSIDEEMIEIQKAQRAFEAIAKVMATSSSLFDTLLQLK